MNIKLYFLILILSISYAAKAQHLKPKGILGIGAEPVSELVVREKKLPRTQGYIIKQVMANTTASAMGLKVDDFILSVNGIEIISGQDFGQALSKLITGEVIRIKIFREGKEILLEEIVKGVVLSYPDDVVYQLGEMQYDNGYVRTIMFSPRGSRGKLPVIYLIQGYPCFSMQYMPKNHPYRTAITAFVKKGYAVFIVEKPGMGDSKAATPCQQIGFDKELGVFKKGYEQLQREPLIDTSKIIIFGHSLGGFIAPILAEQYHPQSVIVYGCGLKPWHDYLIDLMREQAPLQGVDYAQAEDTLNNYRQLLYDYFYKKMSPAQLIEHDARNKKGLVQQMQFDGKDQIIGRHYTFWQELNDHNLAKAWKNTDANVLSIFGESDIAALKPRDMERIAEIVNHYHPGKAKYYFVPKTNHDMVITGSMLENVKIQMSPGYQAYLDTKFNYQLIDMMDEWIRSGFEKK